MFVRHVKDIYNIFITIELCYQIWVLFAKTTSMNFWKYKEVLKDRRRNFQKFQFYFLKTFFLVEVTKAAYCLLKITVEI